MDFDLFLYYTHKPIKKEYIMKTYKLTQLRKMVIKLNTNSLKWLGYDCAWQMEVQQINARLKRSVYIYSRNVGSIEFLETDVGSNEFKFTVCNGVSEWSGDDVINEIAQHLGLI